jgi:hypothetical protein
MRIELARGERQQRCWDADPDGAVDRQCGGGKVTRNAFRQESQASQVQKREGQPVKRLDSRHGGELGGLRHDRPAHASGSGGEHRGARRADTIEQWAANEEEHDDLGRDRQ